jgi:rhodanese-related sulfurtransferase
MNSINLSNFHLSMGILIDVRSKEEYEKKHISGSINIPYNELIFNHNKYLNKNKKYFLICSGGVKSKKATNILKIYGYDVTNVLK